MSTSHRGTPTDEPPVAPAPGMALRTYRFLRLGVVAVIAALAISLVKEAVHTGCLQGSISAYYYTPARSVFVGALVAIGLVMVALWGKSVFEDGFLNLAGLLAPVVAFVPTTETDDVRRCAITTATGGDVTSGKVEAAIVRTASHGAVDNDMLAYLLVVGLVIAAIGLRGYRGHRGSDPMVVDHPRAYWVPWVTALVLWLVGAGLYCFKRDNWMYDHTHKPAAIILFVFVVGAVVSVGLYKWQGDESLGDLPSRTWAYLYWGLAAGMTVGAGLVLLLTLVVLPDWWAHHAVFMLEAWMILGLAVFWVAQTVDRWDDGAPPKTHHEVAARREEVRDRRAALAQAEA
ncbi:MAG: hypothetical protein ACXVW4_15510 [Nocardioides sp.]